MFDFEFQFQHYDVSSFLLFSQTEKSLIEHQSFRNVC